MGASIAYHLARQDSGKIVLLERQGLCNGTTGRSGAIVRQHYSNEFTVRMAKESLAVFQQFDDRVGGDCGFITTGLVVMIDETGADALRANVQMQQEQGVTSRIISPEELSEAAPGYNIAGVALACYETARICCSPPSGGHITEAELQERLSGLAFNQPGGWRSAA